MATAPEEKAQLHNGDVIVIVLELVGLRLVLGPARIDRFQLRELQVLCDHGFIVGALVRVLKKTALAPFQV